MHELGLLTSVVAAVERAATDAGASHVREVALCVGELSGAAPEALQGSWPIAVAGTRLADATLTIEFVAAAVWCPTCASEQPVDAFFALACPACNTPTAHLVRGREFQIAWAEWEVARHESQDSTT